MFKREEIEEVDVWVLLQPLLKKLLTSGLAEKLGYTAVVWAMLEHVMIIIIRDLLELSPRAMVLLLNDMPFLARVNIITSSMYVSGNAKLNDEWREIEIDLHNVRSRRNDVIHGFWTTDETESILLRVKTKRKVTVDRSPKTAKDLDHLLTDIVHCAANLKDFHESIQSEKLSAVIKNRDTLPVSPDQSPRAQSRIRARAQKRALKQADRDRTLAQLRNLTPSSREEKGDGEP